MLHGYAGVPLKDLAVACTAGQIHGHHLIDLNHFEELSKCHSVFLVRQPCLDVIVVLKTFSRQSAEAFEEVLKAAMKASAKVYAEMQKALSVRLRYAAVAAGQVEA
jgi:exosome complex component RRP41